MYVRVCEHIIVFTIAHIVEEVAVWPVFLPRSGPREEELWSLGLEHTIRIQRVGSSDQCTSVAG